MLTKIKKCDIIKFGGEKTGSWEGVMNKLQKTSIKIAYSEACRIARRFHEFYEQSAQFFGYETKKETKNFDPESPNGRLMVWVCYEIIKEERQRILELAKGHCWDSMAKDEDIIIQHLKSILELTEVAEEKMEGGDL